METVLGSKAFQDGQKSVSFVLVTFKNIVSKRVGIFADQQAQYNLWMLMFAVLSRQIEALRMGGFRPKVRFQTIGTESTRAGKMP